MSVHSFFTVVLVAAMAVAQSRAAAPGVLPSTASTQLLESLKLASAHKTHTWRDTAPFAGDLVNGYIEIPMGELTKHEFDMSANARKVDRVMPDSMGGYPVNYGYVPQTVSYDGDPFDVLVLGPALPGGELVQGIVVGLMLMEDEKGLDSKVVISPVDADGKAKYALTPEDQARIGEYFNTYKAKDEDPKTWSKVPGWGTAEDGWSYVLTTAAFFQQCRVHTDRPCSVVL